MCDATLYGGLELSRPHIPARSHLCALPPIGVGTAFVESLTGYIQRLAVAHTVETGTLVNRELLPRIPYTKGTRAGQAPAKPPDYSFYFGAHTLNGTGHRTRLWVAVLEELTRVQRLDLLTALPWANAISCGHLLRTSRAWCPSCYQNWHSLRQPLYEQLLWMFQMVTVCPSHRQSLESRCPECGRTQYVFSSKSRPGYCSRCQSWLGRSCEADAGDVDLTDQQRAAEMVGELLAVSPCIRGTVGTDLFRKNVRTLVRKAGGGLQLRASIQGANVRSSMRWRNVPQIDSLLRLSRNLNVSIVRVLTESIESNSETNHKSALHIRANVPGRVVEQDLECALRAGIPPSLKVPANQLVASLRNPNPKLRRELASGSHEMPNVSSHRADMAPVPRERIESALVEELNKDGFTVLRVVAASVGLTSKRRIYEEFRELRMAIVAKNAKFRKRQGATVETCVRAEIERALRSSFNEQAIPTVAEVAHRLGFTAVRPVTWRFPELTAELRACRRRARRSECAHPVSENVRQRLAEALAEHPPPPCSEIVKRVAGHKTQIREGFPDLWRALRARYVEHQREVRSLKRQAFSADVHRVVAELLQKGIYPTAQVVLSCMPAPLLRSMEIVAEAVRHARRELSIGPYTAYRG